MIFFVSFFTEFRGGIPFHSNLNGLETKLETGFLIGVERANGRSVFTGFYWVSWRSLLRTVSLLGFTGFFCVITGFYWVFLCHYWVLLGFSVSLLGFTGFFSRIKSFANDI